MLLAQTLAAAWRDPGPGRGAFALTAWVCRVEGRLDRRGLFWDVISSPALSESSESLGPGRVCPRSLARAGTGRDLSASEPSELLRPEGACPGPCPGPLALAGMGYGPAHNLSHGTLWRDSEWRRGAPLASVPPVPTVFGATPRLSDPSYPASRSIVITKGGSRWVCFKSSAWMGAFVLA